MHTSISSRKTKSTYTLIIILATLLVLSGAGVTLSPTQAFADEGKDKADHKPEPKKDEHKPEPKKEET